MKIHILLFVSLITVGCSGSGSDDSRSSDDGAPVEDITPSTTATLDADIILNAALFVINTDVLEVASFAPSDADTALIESDDPTVLNLECPISGFITVVNDPPSFGDMSFNDCVIDDVLYNGRINTISASGIRSVVFEDYSITREDSQLDIERGAFSYIESLDFFNPSTWSWQTTTFSSVTADHSIDATINNLILERTGFDEHRAEFDASVMVDGAQIVVTTDTPLESQSGDSFYTSGQIRISNNDGFSILIDADGGDPDSALIAVTNDVSIESEIRAWSDSFQIDCLSEFFPFGPTVDCNL